ncbi:MAG TPA: type II toxin-antitoxin system VapB family antitoxin [Thermoanaerobaculia bacterium]|nr:type II toxin-antitoxin system VapB family antitoxin [Thermoanaerobaculia bacterium]
MATNLELDDSLVTRAMQVTGIRTKKALVEEALRTLIRQTEQREVRDLRGRLHWGERPAGTKRGGGA